MARGAGWARIARVAIALALVAYLVHRAINDGAGEPTDLRAGWIVGATLMLLPAVYVRSVSFALLANRDSRVLNVRDALALTLAGTGIALFMPTGAADLAKAHWGWRRHGNPEAMVVASVLDKVTSLVALALVVAVGSFLSNAYFTSAVGALAAGVSIAVLVFGHRLPWRWLVRFLAPGAVIDDEALVRLCRPSLPLTLRVVAVSLVGWFLTFGITWLACRGVGVDVGFDRMLVLGPVATLARLAPVSVAGIGVGELALAVLLEAEGVGSTLAAQAVLVSMLILVMVPGAVGALLIASARSREREG